MFVASMSLEIPSPADPQGLSKSTSKVLFRDLNVHRIVVTVDRDLRMTGRGSLTTDLMDRTNLIISKIDGLRDHNVRDPTPL